MKTELSTDNILKILELSRRFALYCIENNIPSEVAGTVNDDLRNIWYEKRTEYIKENWHKVLIDEVRKFTGYKQNLELK